jgi:hypothetical protein
MSVENAALLFRAAIINLTRRREGGSGERAIGGWDCCIVQSREAFSRTGILCGFSTWDEERSCETAMYILRGGGGAQCTVFLFISLKRRVRAARPKLIGK